MTNNAYNFFEKPKNQIKTKPTKSKISSEYKGRDKEVSNDTAMYMSEEEMMKIEELRANSKFYHSKQKGCHIVDSPYTTKKAMIALKFMQSECVTHDVVVCRCGWQVGFHFGEPSWSL